MTLGSRSGASHHRPVRRRAKLVAAFAAVSLAFASAATWQATGWSLAADAPASKPASKPSTRKYTKKPTTASASKSTSKPASQAAATVPAYVPTARDLETIAEMERYYANLYAKPLELEGNARLAHLISVGSLSRIDAARITKNLLFIANRGKADPRVAQMAWEALSARYGSLTADERTAWLDAGLAIADVGGFPGETVGPLLDALATEPADARSTPKVDGRLHSAKAPTAKTDAKVEPPPPTTAKAADPKDLAKAAKALDALLLRVAEENDPAVPAGQRALDSAAAAIASWSDKEMVLKLVRQMGRSPNWAKRIDLMLRKLPNPPGTDLPPASAWAKWVATTDLSASPASRPATAPSTRPGAYSGSTALFPQPQRIINPKDPKWSADIELPKLQLAEVNVAFCVDATGSMAESNEYVTAYLEMAVKGLSLLSPTIKAGAVYYRHENVKEVMVACCKEASTDRKSFLVRTMPLTSDVPGLVKVMKAQRIEGKSGHDGGGGAYLSAITTAATLLGPPRKDVARVAVIVGDTYVTKGSEKAIVEVAKEAAKQGLILVFVVRDQRAATSVSAASKAATGLEAIQYLADLNKAKDRSVDPADGFVNTAFGKAAQQAIATMVSKGYANRIPPLFSNSWRIFVAEARAEKAKATVK